MDVIVQWLNRGRKEIVYVVTILFPNVSYNFEVINL